jgi:hypothetical protein
MKTPPRGIGAASRFFQPRQPDRPAGVDFAWPPPAEDLARCEIVPLGEEDVPTLPAWGPDDYVPAPAVTAAAPSAKVRRRNRVPRPPVEDCDPLCQFASDPEAAADPWSRAELLRAAAALFVGISLAAVSYSQFRGARTAASRGPIVIEQVVSAADTIDLPAAPAPARQHASHGNEGLALLRGTSLPERTPDPIRSAAPATRDEVPVRITPAVLTTSSRDVASLAPAPPPVASRAVEAPRVEPRPLPIAPLDLAPPAAAPAPEPIAVVARVEPSRDEEHIRSTLAQWRTAYSQLDAGAAREVWPSVDVRALEKAFQSLKSQELSFDHCAFTVTGARAQAACTGRASYVPRVGNPAPKTNAREWTFELTRSDQRWTIASARSS